MRNLFIVIFSIFLTACAAKGTLNNNPNNANAKLSQWQGLPMDAVIIKLGTANESFQTRDGYTFYVYTTQNYQTYPSSGLAPGYATMTRGYVQVPAQESFYANYSILKCALIFKTNSQGIITGTNTKGYNCDSTLAYLNK
jgi:hypothetical protein